VKTHVQLRPVRESDLPIFYEQQLDPEAARMAAFPSRAHDAFMAHWARILATPDETITLTVLFEDQVAGNIGSWQQDRERLVGYWIGRDHWGRGIATAALALFLSEVKTRPLHAHVVQHNRASVRVLEKCGFVLNISPPWSPAVPNGNLSPPAEVQISPDEGGECHYTLS
jgi:RimJ/RimL family protein N-acetyltransferase